MSQVFVFTQTGPGQGSWSQYRFPFAIHGFAQLGNKLYIRHQIDGVDRISEVVENVLYDRWMDGEETVTTYFDGDVQWPFLDYGNTGVTKMMEGFDLVASMPANVTFRYDQSDLAVETPDYTVSPGDTIPGTIVPMPFAAPSFGPRVRFAGSADQTQWKFTALDVVFHDFGAPR